MEQQALAVRNRESHKIRSVFPSQPVEHPERLASRERTLDRCRKVIETPGQTLILYGDFGVGKTSVWRVLLRSQRYASLVVGRDTSLCQVFLQLFEDYGFGISPTKITKRTKSQGGLSGSLGPVTLKSGADHETGREETPLERPRLNVPILVRELRKLSSRLDYIVIEEVGRLRDPGDHDDLAHLLKALSDDVDCSVGLVVVGQARSSGELIPSVEFAAYQNRIAFGIEVAPFAEHETMRLLGARELELQAKFLDSAKERIAYISSGYPWIANTLAREACLNCVWQRSPNLVAPTARQTIRRNLRERFGFGTRSVATPVRLEITDGDLRAAVVELTERATQDSVEWYRSMQFHESVDAARVLVLAHLLASRDTVMTLADAGERLGLPAARVSRIIGKHAARFVSVTDGRYVGLNDQHLRWFCRAIEYISPEGVGVETRAPV